MTDQQEKDEIPQEENERDNAWYQSATEINTLYPEEELSYEITEENAFIIFYKKAVIYSSREFRLRAQAETKARDWIALHTAAEQITSDTFLEVQDVSISSYALIFGGRNGKINP